MSLITYGVPPAATVIKLKKITAQKLEIRLAPDAFAGSIALWGRSKLAESTDFVRLVMERCEEHPMEMDMQ